ncbi:MAG: bifunctional (p)ppGpp synthetase/guanosine-3',5'-bis(diphosphate) 3'-pyrophosphohydrolase [Oscillospiraceae bacterium]|nr:bifunctional (p)ppGpp synthetase/guanosine-3',5'-bis(diphosphate) 3'-pyrophosphohydrolase [Oscillospiraceae bacterium]
MEKLYAELEEKTLRYDPNLDRARLRAAYEYARDKHAGQLRKDGTPYISHPLAAAGICAGMGLDEDSIIACLLHDTIEDTDATYQEVAKRFGTEVADIVEGVTKLTRVTYTTKEEAQMENLRKMLLAMSKDIRVILIKIADRLHNMHTMNFQSEAKRREKALETMEIYAPLAHRLGMQRVKWELEDLSLIYLDPIGYQEIVVQLDARMEELSEFMDSVQERIRKRMEDCNIRCEVSGRLKHIYSIYRKMAAQNKRFNEILDLCAFRVIVDSVQDCYNVLGQIHELFTPIPGRFKDYIATPKPNMYQSIHTSVIGSEGIPFEVQIRTWEMHHTAEYGVAAHWKYKDGIEGRADEDKFAWIRSLLEAQQDTEAPEFISELKVDMFSDEVFVFTPKGDVINLPAGATPIDFAYSIHSQVGNHMTGAKVNGRIVPFDRVLENGDIVEVSTSPTAKGPGRDWISLAKSATARTKIRQWFKKERREENIVRGRAAMEASLKHAGISADVLADAELMAVVEKRLAVTSLDDLFAAVGYGGMTTVRCLNRIKEELARTQKEHKVQPEDLLVKEPAPRSGGVDGVLVGDLDNCLVKFSRCCTPVPGDGVVGFITRGSGVSIHRKDCLNYQKALREGEGGRWVPVSWADTAGRQYTAALDITADARQNLILDIVTAMNAEKAGVTSLNIRETGDGGAIAFLTVLVKDLETLNSAVRHLRGIRGVRDVQRPGCEEPMREKRAGA